ncbi:MAG: protein-disulfide reductase DsbD [Xanthomonadales bacterium]|nr:protein-disulfide reductase DsbD [Xanthomonadales bacterium]
MLAPNAGAVGFDEVLPYDQAYQISASAPSRDMVEVRWQIGPDYYLYNNKFLQFETTTPGVTLGAPLAPPGKKQYDELLGEEVVKYHDFVRITVPLDAVPAGTERVALQVQSQGCLEAVLCYPPTTQHVSVTLPPAPAAAGASLASAFEAQGSAASVSLPGDRLGLAEEPSGKAEALAPDDAFVYEAIGLSAETALVRFTVQPGYYLYVDQFAFRVVGDDRFEVRSVSLPEGTIKDDPEFGPVPVIYDQVEIPVRLNRPAGPEQMISLEADYQGCRDGDICYPPQQGLATFLLAGSDRPVDEPVTVTERLPASRVNAAPPPISEQDRLATLLVENPAMALLAFFIAGLLLAFTPCVFPMVPILSGIIAGEGDRLTTSRAFWLSLVYVLAMAATYTAAGVLAGLFGKNLQAVFQNPWVIVSFVTLFVLLALSMFGFYELQLPSRWQTAMTERSNRAQGGRFGGVAVMGFLSALIVGPCVAPPLAAALIVIGASGDAVLGGTALFALSMGMGVPLILFGVSAGKLIPRAGAWMDAVKAVFGVGLLALAVWMLERIIPGPVILLLWGLLAIGSGVFMGALQSLPPDASGWKRLWKALGLALLVIGAAELLGAAAGNSNWVKPLAGVGMGQHEAEHVAFRRIKSLDDLRVALEQSAAAGKPAMLDFYADWCVECIRMERNTFPEPAVQALLAQLQPLQADVTPNDEVDQALMREFGIIGPPAILFFDRSGKEMEAYRLVGYFKPDSFAAHLQRVIDGS